MKIQIAVCKQVLPAAAAFAAAAATFVATAAAATLVATAAAATFVATAAATFVAAATTTAAAVATTTAATWTSFLGFGWVHTKWTTIVVIIVEGFDSRVQLGLVTEGDESKSLGLPGFTIRDDFDPFDRSKSGKETSDVSFSSSVGQVAHVDIHCFQFL